MVRLNKNQLTEQQLTALYSQMSGALGALDAKSADKFFSELLGYEERIMLAKRLAIIILLLEGASLYKIGNVLKVSSATAEKVRRELDAGKYGHTIAILGKNKKDYFKILDTLDAILHLGGILPHYNGPDRWKHLKRSL